VTSPETYALLRREARTVWLKARPNDYWNRVTRQGDRRPTETPRAREALRDLIERRDPLYARADLTVDTSGLTIAETADRVERVLAPGR
jgi:XRE family aerobic/anaerobic benzoate catabolism transcriptional regulator